MRAEGKGKELMGLPIHPMSTSCGESQLPVRSSAPRRARMFLSPILPHPGSPHTPDWPGIPLAFFWISSLNRGG